MVAQGPTEGTRVNGIRAVTMTLIDAQGNNKLLDPNTEIFTLLAAAINTGIKIIESDAGRQAFAATGRDVVAKWSRDGSTTFWGEPDHMESYLHVFLEKVRGDFPRVLIASISNPDQIAEYRRMDGVDSNFGGIINNYNAKGAGGIYFNASRVLAMVSAAAGTDRKHRERYLNFHFLFAAATAHELMHAFVTMLARSSNTPDKFTPPGTTHLNYGGPPDEEDIDGTGESGRFMERLLFGGSLEFYRDPNDDNGQCGIVHRLDDHAVAKRLSPESCWKIARHEDFTFPIATVGPDITQQQRRQMNLRSLGSIQPHTTAIAGPALNMRARKEEWYNLSGTELQEVVTKNRRALTVHAVKVGA